MAENPRTGEPLMSEEAICMSIVQKAMKGDIQMGEVNPAHGFVGIL